METSIAILFPIEEAVFFTTDPDLLLFSRHPVEKL